MSIAERWVEAYAKWPPTNQLAFSAVLLLAALVVLVVVGYLFYLLVYYAAVAVRGWPDDTDRPRWSEVVALSRSMEAYKEWEKRRAKDAPPPSEKP